MKKILIVVDYQNDFVSPTGALPVPNADTIADNIQSRIDDNTYEKVIYTFDTHSKEQYYGSDEQQIFPDIHCEFGTDGWELYKIKPQYEAYVTSNRANTTFSKMTIGKEVFITKDVFNVWEGSKGYAKWFEYNFPKDEFEVDIVGVAVEFCVKMNIQGLTDRGYKVNLIQNCVAGITEEGISEAMKVFSESSVNFK